MRRSAGVFRATAAASVAIAAQCLAWVARLGPARLMIVVTQRRRSLLAEARSFRFTTSLASGRKRAAARVRAGRTGSALRVGRVDVAVDRRRRRVPEPLGVRYGAATRCQSSR